MTEKMTVKKARWLRRLSWVPRWAVVPVLHKQSVAEHSFHVIVLCRWLLPLHARSGQGNFELEVLRRAIEHDADEAKSGDIPSPYKTRDETAEQSQVDAVVKCADKLEALLYVMEEIKLGNSLSMDELYEDVLGRFMKAWELLELNPNYHGISASQIVESASKIVYDKNAAHPSLEAGGYGD